MMYPFYLLVAVMPMVRHQFWSMTSVAGLTMNKWLGLTAFAMACMYLTIRPAPPRPFQTPQAPLFVLFGVLTTLSFLVRGPENAAVELSPAGNWVSFILVFFMILALVDSRSRFKWTLFCAIGGVAFAGLHLLREWQAYGGMGAVRPGWVAGDPNYFALSALTCLPMAFLFSEVRLPSWQRMGMRICLVVTLLAFFLTGSRGGMLGLITSLIVVAVRSPRRSYYLSVGGLAVFFLLLVTPTSPLWRVLDPGRAETSSTLAHTTLLWAGLRMFRENFFLGIGVGNFKLHLNDYLGPDDPNLMHVAHNTFLEVGCELGVLGLILFVAIIVLTFRTLARVGRATARGRDPLLHLAARGLEAGVAGTCVGMFFISALHSRLFWLLVILTMCLPALPSPARPARARRARRTPEETRPAREDGRDG